MAEVQTTTQSGELTQRFIEFVMMQAQNAALFLGQIPNPQSGQGEVNLELARMFIDQLAMIQEKTRGNLSSEEAGVLRNTLANLQMAFVEVSQAAGGTSVAPATKPPPPQPEEAAEEPAAPAAAPNESPGTAASSPETESRKKFTKSYGA
ncbi:MAG TPA: DUF1844 domain-containing protein [Chthoniobacterales bacterium]|nr:DUF1844 domain-containing protein [Chthoniobacterales bacterium]